MTGSESFGFYFHKDLLSADGESLRLPGRDATP
jgi:hypothetical protein